MSRLEALVSAGLVYLVALVVLMWAATQITFPRPEDVAYYVGVARNLVDGRGLISDAIWSFQTPPLSFPRPAFEVWLPLPSFLAAIPMSLFGTTFAAAQISSIVAGSIVAVLAWRLGADVAEAREMPVGRARALALGTGLTAAVYLPLVLASVQPDSTMPFAALVLGACLVMYRIERTVGPALGRAAPPVEPPTDDPAGVIEYAPSGPLPHPLDAVDVPDVVRSAALRQSIALGVLLGLAALTRNDAIWLALVWALMAWRIARNTSHLANQRWRAWLELVWPSAIAAVIVFAPWAIRDWLAFGSPFPGQAVSNALSLDGRDIFAWQDRPTLSGYLAAGLPKLLELRVTGTVHNLLNVLLLLGVPVSILGLVGLPAALDGKSPELKAMGRETRRQVQAEVDQCIASGELPDDGGHRFRLGPFGFGRRRPTAIWGFDHPLRPLGWFSVLTFLIASLFFPVATTWGTFLHAAGAIHVLFVISALLVLDGVIVWAGARRGWTRPVAWLGPTFAIAGCLLFSGVLLADDGRASRDTGVKYEALAAALVDPSFAAPLDTEPGPIMTDFPIWLAEATRHHTLALPNEPPDSILDLARTFDPPARLLVVDAGNTGVWPAAIFSGAPGSECFVPLDLPAVPGHPGALDDVLVFRIRC